MPISQFARISAAFVVKGLHNRKNYRSYELLLDAGDFDDFGWSSRNRAETENDSDFLVYRKVKSLNLFVV